MTRVKICGITNLEDALVAVQTGADFLGFIFYERSPRYVIPEAVLRIVSRLNEEGLRVKGQVSGQEDRALPKFVGVFVDAPLETVTHILDYCQLDVAQLHGGESPESVDHFQGRAFKALRPQSQEEAEAQIKKYLPGSFAPLLPYFLLDAYHPRLYGGTGHVTNWTMAARIARQYPIMLAGSLTPTNVAEAIRVVRPWGVDVSSGVEAEKGKKDHEKVREFVRTVKSIKRKT